MFAELKADIVIIDTESPSRDVLEQICVMTQDAPRPVSWSSEDTQPAAIKAAIKKQGCPVMWIEDIDAGRLRCCFWRLLKPVLSK
ncbi:MAG: hypothetical protein IPM78_06255, partial [Moraxellaceae bacterium]|nr:hypothetical protein [Moraxellaceae bacterium]